MGIETALPDRKGKVYCELPKETNSRSKRSRRRPRKVSPVQKLFDTCKEVFSSCGAGIVPPPHDVEKLASVLSMLFLLLLLPFFFFYCFLMSATRVLDGVDSDDVLIRIPHCMCLKFSNWVALKLLH